MILNAVRILIQRSVIVLEGNLKSEGGPNRHVFGEEGESSQIHLRLVEEGMVVAELLVHYKAGSSLVQFQTLFGAVLIDEIIGAVAVCLVGGLEAGAPVEAWAVLNINNSSLGPNYKEDEQSCKH